MSFGNNLKRIRANKHISQGDLAQMIAVHASHVSRYERNLSSPTIDVVKKIASALEVSTDQLIYGSEDQVLSTQIKDTELIQLFSKVQQLSKSDIVCVKTMLKAFVFHKDIQKRLTEESSQQPNLDK